jgi:hypothetical protein
MYRNILPNLSCIFHSLIRRSTMHADEKTSLNKQRSKSCTNMFKISCLYSEKRESETISVVHSVGRKVIALEKQVILQKDTSSSTNLSHRKGI